MNPLRPHVLPVVLALLLLAGPAYARTPYVDRTGSPGGQVWVAQGVYLPTTTTDRATTHTAGSQTEKPN